VIDAVRLTTAALREARTPPAGELRVRALPGAPGGTFLGLDAEGRSHLLIESADRTEASTATAAVTMGHRVLEIGGHARGMVDIVCEIPAVSEVFDHFIAAVVERLRETGDPPVTVVLEIVERWRRLLAGETGAPGRDRLAAIFGELLVLLDVVRADPRRRVDVWVGPHGGRHDLRRGDLAIEVKTTRSHTARVVTVHGEDQLLEPEGGSLYLQLVRLEDVPEGGGSVPELVDGLLTSGAPAGEVFDAVAASGLVPADYPAAATIRFDVRERLTVPVDDETPRIVPATFAAGARPVGVVDLVYRLDLDHSLGRALDPSAYTRLIVGLAGAEAA
jgi:hypothetical protein